MKTITIITTGLILFLGTFSVAFAQDNDTLKTIFNRKSVRTFTDAAVSKDQLILMVKAGMAAPTACDARPWDFIVITDKECLKKLADALPTSKPAERAAAAIVITGTLSRECKGKDGSYWMLDCSAASENILLAAESMGLGAVWTAVWPETDRIELVRKILGIPEGVVPLNIICIGVTKAKDTAKDKFDAKLIHTDKW
jgi:nitroreductase